MRNVTSLFICLVASVCAARGASLTGTVVDRSGGAIAGARVGLFNRVGLVDERITGKGGEFEFEGSPVDAKLIVTAPGFATRTIFAPTQNSAPIQLELAPFARAARSNPDS